jgi:integrase
LTDRLVRSLVPEIGRAVPVYDDRCPGLRVAVFPSGQRSWQFIYGHGGRARWLTLGSATLIPVAEARKLAAAAALAVAQGRDPQAEKRGERRAGTFGELCELYLETHAKRRNRSWRQGDRLIRANALPSLGRKKANSITRGDVRLVLARLDDRPATANQTLAAISAVFSWAIGEEVGGVAANPCARIARHEARSRERVLADGELRSIWHEFDPALKLILLTGQRPGEVFSMRRQDIVDGFWHLSGQPTEDGSWPGTKNSRDHRVWLSEPALGLVEAHLADRLRRRSEERLRKLWTRLGIEKVRPHDLRRTCLTTITRLGFSRDAMDRISNHRGGGVRDTYDRYGYENEDRAIMAAVARHIVSIVEGRTEGGNVVQLR